MTRRARQSRPVMLAIGFAALATVAIIAVAGTQPAPARGDVVCGDLIRLNDNGAWSWFQDERAIVDAGRILVSSSASASGPGGDARSGNVEVVAHDLATGRSSAHILATLQPDDHDSAGLLARPDGRYLAVYGAHHVDHLTRYRISLAPGDPSSWQPERTFDHGVPRTYANVYHLSAEGQTYTFTRANGFDPRVLVSGDQGETWTDAGWLLKDPGGAPAARPYARYATNGRDRIWFITTEDHPNRANTSVYAGYLESGAVHRMDGAVIGSVAPTLEAAPSVAELTPVLLADPEGIVGSRTRAWTVDVEVDGDGVPAAILSTRIETDGDPRTPDTTDHRFLYARWSGTRWDIHELARAGGGLYRGEDDYTGLAALDPLDPGAVYISTPIDPSSGSVTRHHEVYRGSTPDRGVSWTWRPITRDSTVDNLRPIVPRWDGSKTAVLWLRGVYASFTDYATAVVGVIETRGSPADCAPVA